MVGCVNYFSCIKPHSSSIKLIFAPFDRSVQKGGNNRRSDSKPLFLITYLLNHSWNWKGSSPLGRWDDLGLYLLTDWLVPDQKETSQMELQIRVVSLKQERGKSPSPFCSVFISCFNTLALPSHQHWGRGAVLRPGCSCEKERERLFL